MWDLNIRISNACCLGGEIDVVPKGSYFPFRIFVSFVDYSEESYPDIFRTASMLIVKANLTPLTYYILLFEDDVTGSAIWRQM